MAHSGAFAGYSPFGVGHRHRAKRRAEPGRTACAERERPKFEAIAAEAYRSGALTAHQVGEMLGHGSRWETESFLKQAQAYLHYTEDDLEHDLAALRAAGC